MAPAAGDRFIFGGPASASVLSWAGGSGQSGLTKEADASDGESF